MLKDLSFYGVLNVKSVHVGMLSLSYPVYSSDCLCLRTSTKTQVQSIRNGQDRRCSTYLSEGSTMKTCVASIKLRPLQPVLVKIFRDLAFKGVLGSDQYRIGRRSTGMS